MNSDDEPAARLAAEAAVTAGLLDAGRTVSLVCGTTLLAAAALGLLGQPLRPMALLAAGAIALPQGYFAQRARFDAGILRLWASRWHRTADAAADLAAFDARLGRPARPAATLAADLAERCRGARRLLKWQAACGVLQLGLTALAVWP